MKKISIMFVLIAGLIMAACSNDDEPTSGLTCEYFEATTWDAKLSEKTSPNSSSITSHFIMQFISKSSGKCIAAYGDDSYEGSFTYFINKDMFTFNGSIVGNWTVVKRTNTQIVLQAFLPYENNLVLTKK